MALLHPAVEGLGVAAQQLGCSLDGQGVRLVCPALGQPLPKTLAVLRRGLENRLPLGPGLGGMVRAELPRQLPKKAGLLLHAALEFHRVLPADTVPVGGLACVLVGDIVVVHQVLQLAGGDVQILPQLAAGEHGIDIHSFLFSVAVTEGEQSLISSAF